MPALPARMSAGSTRSARGPSRRAGRCRDLRREGGSRSREPRQPRIRTAVAYTDSALDRRLDRRLDARFDVVRGAPSGRWDTSLRTVLAEWGRIGCVGFGGPPSHIAMLRTLCVQRRVWLTSEDFEDAVVACNLLPGPSSTQLAIYCAWRVRGRAGALVGGLAFIIPGLVIILVLAAQFPRRVPARLGRRCRWRRRCGRCCRCRAGRDRSRRVRSSLFSEAGQHQMSTVEPNV